MKLIESIAGESLWNMITRAKELAEEEYGIVEAIFNDVKLRISEDSCEHDIAEIYRLKRKCGEYIK
jgi:hypothetical protein